MNQVFYPRCPLSLSRWTKECEMKKFLLLCLPLVHAVAFYYFANFILEPYKSRGQAQILSKKGNKFLRIDAVEEALKAYQQTVELNPENKFAWNILGLIYSDQEKNQDALEVYDQALQILPQASILWNNRGTVLVKMDELEKALLSFDRALELDTKYSDAWNNRGVVFLELGRLPEAIIALDRSIELDPKDGNTWYNLARVYGAMKNKEQTLSSLKRALQWDPDKKKGIHKEPAFKFLLTEERFKMLSNKPD